MRVTVHKKSWVLVWRACSEVEVKDGLQLFLFLEESLEVKFRGV